MVDLSESIEFNIMGVNQNKKQIELFLNKKQNEIRSLLKVDFYIYNQIKNSSYYWNWFNGRIF